MKRGMQRSSRLERQSEPKCVDLRGSEPQRALRSGRHRRCHESRNPPSSIPRCWEVGKLIPIAFKIRKGKGDEHDSETDIPYLSAVDPGLAGRDGPDAA